jgi:hypothetical protein
MEAVGASETFPTFYYTAQWHTPEDSSEAAQSAVLETWWSHRHSGGVQHTKAQQTEHCRMSLSAQEGETGVHPAARKTRVSSGLAVLL